MHKKQEWLEMGIKSEIGRCCKIYNNSFTFDYPLPKNEKSVFDPVLCELMYKWFNVPGGFIVDPFAGGSVRGIVAEKMGYPYIGIDLRPEQVDANRVNALECGVMPAWICDDAKNICNHIPAASADMIFSCPPYAWLEKYSDDPRDLSNMKYDVFMESYTDIIQKAASVLKDNRFFVLVVGEVRGKNGAYLGLVPDTIKAAASAGLTYYNEIILSTCAGTLPIRVSKQMNSTRKIGKKHQNVLVFFKGDMKKIKEEFSCVTF